ncbi:hypothetical protein AD006_23615 [Pseudonocardia sp. EC080610-09]|uniref:hypothetical protein n=1 Tax=unclassified Pseudonocardia TaxID=2619320 RepID=UPI0006CB4AE7|nr:MULTISPECIES: hypothetical protein [unclassified Pseudonocardia]ALE74137.1 hypothetical protein FRP1_15965 [Pseudonocardia sp. EC080625-04]ALL77549.1 hypothetical protein AD006_23615 [Pseudonocardia sp. EC080610-09]ALL80465.1 hypothetical protein AD017_03205 [Pseudonocardia sp. EC080619-01]
MGRHDRNDGSEGASRGEAEMLDLSEISAEDLRDRLSARSDGRDERVVHAATELRASLDRLTGAIAYRREALVTRAGEIVRAAAPFAGGAAAAGVGALLVVRRARRPRRS